MAEEGLDKGGGHGLPYVRQPAISLPSGEERRISGWWDQSLLRAPRGPSKGRNTPSCCYLTIVVLLIAIFIREREDRPPPVGDATVGGRRGPLCCLERGEESDGADASTTLLNKGCCYMGFISLS